MLRLGGLAAIVITLAACSAGSPSGVSPSAAIAPAAGASTAPSVTAELTIYAATSLKSALDKAKAVYETTRPGTTLVISTDASSALGVKIEQGAPADVFLSADTANPQKLVDKGLTVGDPLDFARNMLCVIVPSDNPGRIQTPADLAKAGIKVIAAGDAVPITKYASQLVGKLANQPGYPADFAAAYDANVASEEENVGGIVAKVATGQGDAGIVYVTDANGKADLKTIDVPTDANVLATYAGVVVKATQDPAAAEGFLTWIAGPDGQAILRGFGFLPPS
jgi:molybdate transport system substrate-binding protein